MSDTSPSPGSLDPEAGITPGPSSTSAGADLRKAAGDLQTAAVGKVREVVDAAAAQTAAAKDKVLETAHHLKDVASEKTKQIAESTAERWSETRETAQNLQATAEDYIRENPIKSVLGALGVGFLIGLVLRR